MPLSKQEEELRQKFIEFGQRRFGKSRGWMTRYAKALGIQLSQVSSYAKGRIAVGAGLREKMREIGADPDGRMTGKASSLKEELAQFVRDHPGSIIPENLPEKTRKQIKLLIEEVSKLDEGDVEKVRAVIRTIFNTKKGK